MTEKPMTEKQRRWTQEERILRFMEGGVWVCGTVFLADYMPRYSAAIHTLRHVRGYGIEGRPCQQHRHPQVYEFRITRWPPPVQMTWTGSAG